ncbi:non-heme iron oxygenase ferredoxin subunit [Kitasatospora sp. NBC_01287]|uniref:non-heme iron oxygenase ferredoxin subunit n=1 Tax=Kitasatospora sp. NBC_01287 TaxID=2903573 RepID=UPI002255C360|nr:non-heme iron oxygenase ferredoxin subunit [Kitasatospora sp. NBC_01287]MCX4746238.1 non-heme iron oxygenase ferredoxin subunit [Kitasatospora sp. NBC_01287]
MSERAGGAAYVRVCSLNELGEDSPKRVELGGGLAISVVRTGGEVFAINDICSHANVSLSEGEVEDCRIECWLHGSAFDLRTGKPSGLPATRPVPVYPVKIEGDDVLVSVTQES